MNFTISNELDYSLHSLEERKAKVEEILNRFDTDLAEYYDTYHKVSVCQQQKTSDYDYMAKDLEKVADYLLYMDNKEKREKDNTLNKRQEMNRKKKEVLTEDFTFTEESRSEINKNSRVYGKIKVYEQDRKEHKELREIDDLKKRLKEQIKSKQDSKGNSLNNEQLKKLRWFLIDIGKDEVAMKEQLKRYITFKNITPSIPFYDLKNFTFSNPKHNKALIDVYQPLKEKVQNKTDDDIKILLFVFEDLISKAITEPILKTILELKTRGLSQKEIIQEIQYSFNIKISPIRLSQLTNQTIPNLIADEYKQQFEDWIFTYVKKGQYKQCCTCNNNYLATNKYFGKDNQRKDGFNPTCKPCRKTKK